MDGRTRDAADVGAAKRGDRAAFTRLHERYARVVHAVLLARVPAQDAEELVQEVFIVAWRRLRDVQDDRAFGGWLCTVARNQAVDFHRVRKIHVPVEERGAPPPPVAEANEALAAIRALPEAYHETLLMRLVEGMTGPEIAERTGLTEGSVRVNLCRGMALLRERLDGRAAL